MITKIIQSCTNPNYAHKPTYTHKIYLVDYTFKKINSDDEQKLINDNDAYKMYREGVIRSMKSRSLDKVFPENFFGLVKYIPSNDNKDIGESADIILHVCNQEKVNLSAYRSAIEILKDFINNNNIKNIQLSSCDSINDEINLVDDLSACKPLKVIEISRL